MKLRDIKKTSHEYKGFTIKGGEIRTSGGWVLGMRHWKEGGTTRNYEIWEGERRLYRSQIYLRLSHAKEEIDDIIKIRKSQIEKLKWYKDRGTSKESLIERNSLHGFSVSFINEYYDKI